MLFNSELGAVRRRRPTKKLKNLLRSSQKARFRTFRVIDVPIIADALRHVKHLQAF
jgi:hypothetical protein